MWNCIHNPIIMGGCDGCGLEVLAKKKKKKGNQKLELHLCMSNF